MMDNRARALVALRSKWLQFGTEIVDSNILGGKVASFETAQIFELGDVDPIEKNAKAYVNELLATEAKVTPVLREAGLRKVQVEMEAQESEKRRIREETLKAAETKMASAAGPSGPKREGKTWASNMAERNKKAPEKDALRTKMVKDQMTGKQIEVDLCTLRVVGLHGVSETELRRLFGEDNGLGRVARMTIPKGEDGQSRGFAYITYHNPDDADAARRKMDGKTFKFIKFAIDYSAVQKK
eukprot:GILI01013960.1.p1 GENE.GILI01013960.1~~GILI01013960.1.p1  ORF type:complete len:241 (-),score=73.19 GILI01013960.1:59-781(-)